MFTIKSLQFALAVLVVAGMFPANANASNYSSNYCSQTTRSLFQACNFDVIDDYSETRANCINIIDDEARAECFSDARTEKWEGWQSCREQKHARQDVCALVGEDRYADPLMNLSISFVEPDEIGPGYPPNPYVNLTQGHTYVLRAGEDFEETVVVHVTDQEREVERGDDEDPVKCRVVVDAVMVLEVDEDDASVTEWVVDELTDDYFAQDDTGIVYYCGEISRNYEDGHLVNLDGSFFSGVDFAKAGVLMRQAPAVGQVDRQEYAPAEAEDLVEYVDLRALPGEEEGGQNSNHPDFSCIGAETGDCLKTLDTSALDPESTEFKYYRRDVGFVLAVSMEDGEFDGEREELVCVGDSLEVLETAACGLDNVEDLLDKLCELSPEAFCTD